MDMNIRVCLHNIESEKTAVKYSLTIPLALRQEIYNTEQYKW